MNGEEGLVAQGPSVAPPEPVSITPRVGTWQGGLESMVINFATVQLFDHLCRPRLHPSAGLSCPLCCLSYLVRAARGRRIQPSRPLCTHFDFSAHHLRTIEECMGCVCGNIVAPRRWVRESCIGFGPRLARAITDRAGPRYLGTTSDVCVPRIPQSSVEHLRYRSPTLRPLSRPPYPARPLRSGDLVAGVGAPNPCEFRSVRAPQPRDFRG